jgi:putative transposase
VYSYNLMPTHFHFVICAPIGAALSEYMRLLLNGHVRQHHRRHGTTGRGHIYQGRFKNFIIGDTRHLTNVLRYVEANALRAKLVDRAEDWPWSSLSSYATHPERPILSEWPVPRPETWARDVNSHLSTFELDRLRVAAQRGRPYGPPDWERAGELADQLKHTFNEPGRPLRPR